MTTWKVGKMTLSNEPKVFTPSYSRSSKDQVYEGRITSSVGTTKADTVTLECVEVFTSYANQLTWERQMREQMKNNDLQPIWLDGDAELEGWYTIESFMPKIEGGKTASITYRLRLKKFGVPSTHVKKFTVESIMIPNEWATGYCPVVGVPVSAVGSLPQHETRTGADGSVPVMKIGNFFEIEDGEIAGTETSGDDAFGGTFVRSADNTYDAPIFKAASALPLNGAYRVLARVRNAATLTPATYSTANADDTHSWNESTGTEYTSALRVHFKQRAYIPSVSELLQMRGGGPAWLWNYTWEHGLAQALKEAMMLAGAGDQVRSFNRNRQTINTEDYTSAFRFNVTGPADYNSVIMDAELVLKRNASDANAKTPVNVYLLGPAAGVAALDSVADANIIRKDAPVVEAVLEGAGDQTINVTSLVRYAVNHPEYGSTSDYIGFKVDSGTLPRAIDKAIEGDSIWNSIFDFTNEGAATHHDLSIQYIDNAVNLWCKSTTGMQTGKALLSQVDNEWVLLPLGTTTFTQGDDFYVFMDQNTADNFDLDCAVLVPARPAVVSYEATEPTSGDCTVLDGTTSVYGPDHVFAGELQASNGLIRITTQADEDSNKGRLKIEAYISSSWTTLGYYRIYDHTDSVDYGGQTPDRIRLLKLSDQVVQFALYFPVNTTSKLVGVFTLKFGQWNFGSRWFGGFGEMDHLIDLNGTTWITRASDTSEHASYESSADIEDNDTEKPYFYCINSSDYALGFCEHDNGDRLIDAVWQTDDISPGSPTLTNITGKVHHKHAVAVVLFDAATSTHGTMFGSRKPFEYLKFKVNTAAHADDSTTWYFWTGSAWSALTIDADGTGSSNDGTDSFDTTGTGVIEFTVPAWVADHNTANYLPDVGEPMYWVMVEFTSGGSSVNPKINYVQKTGRRRWGDDVATDDYYTQIYRRRGGRSINVNVSDCSDNLVYTLASTDDGYYLVTDGNWTTNAQADFLGHTTVQYSDVAHRYVIPSTLAVAADIDLVYLRINVTSQTGGGGETFKIQLIDEDDCAAFGAGGARTGLAGNEIEWTPTGTGWYRIDITAFYKDFINRGGYAADNHIGIKFDSNTCTASEYTNIASYDNTNTSLHPFIEVWMKAAGEEEIMIESLNDYQVTEFVEER